MVRGRLDGSMMKSVGGMGGFSISPADSKNVVLGGADRLFGSSGPASPLVALSPFSGTFAVVQSVSLVVWLRL